MARVLISFYLSILAGIIVLFNHCVTSEIGDVALNKVTGAAARFYTLFQDTARKLKCGCTLQLQTTLCGPSVDSILPPDAVAYLRVRYCQLSAQDSESISGSSNDWEPHGGYGGPDFTLAYCQSPMHPLVPQASAEGLDWSNQPQRHISQAIWDQSSETMAAIGTLLLRSCASWWWFRAPLKVTGFLLGAYSVLSVFGCLFGGGASMVISQVYMAVLADFLRCIEWEAQHQALEIAASMMERGYGLVTYAYKRVQRNAESREL